MRKAKGKIYVLHIEDEAKNSYLSPSMKWDGIRSKADSILCASIPPSCFSLSTIVKAPEETTKDSFCAHVNGISPAVFVCLGWHGRKGAKDDPTVLGSVADVALRSCVHPVIICKQVRE